MENKKKIVVVEDDEILSNVIVEELEENGFDVIVAENGEIGLKLIEKERPDLVILDVLMPVMDGKSVLKELRKNVWGKNMKVVMLTNYDLDDEMVKSIVEYEPSCYVKKSANRISDVSIKVKEILGV
jgi:DNA-binding response OmpR family regulator